MHRLQNLLIQKPEKYESPVSQGGTNVSGGQKQRLSIARAIAKDPEIFIFDDSFSALDFKTDSQLRKALKEYTKDATTVIVAQRISTILGADQIIVLDDGHMAGIGTHKELMANCEVYQQIAKISVIRGGNWHERTEKKRSYGRTWTYDVRRKGERLQGLHG